MVAKKSVKSRKRTPSERSVTQRKEVNLGAIFAGIEDALRGLSLGESDYAAPTDGPARRLLVWTGSGPPGRLILTKESVYHNMDDIFAYLSDLDTPTTEAMQLAEEAWSGMGRLFELFEQELKLQWSRSLEVRLKGASVRANNLVDTYGPAYIDLDEADRPVTAKAEAK